MNSLQCKITNIEEIPNIITRLVTRWILSESMNNVIISLDNGITLILVIEPDGFVSQQYVMKLP